MVSLRDFEFHSEFERAASINFQYIVRVGLQ